MASNDVQVTFGANIATLVAGVEDVKSQIAGIADSAKGLAAAFGVAFSIEGIKNFVEGMAELGERTTTASSILGLTIGDVQKYGFVAKASGVDSETFVQTLARMQTNLELAQSGIGPTARALQAMGLSAKQLAVLPIDQQILKLSDAFAKYADGGQKAALANELVRNGAETLLPAFDKGSEGIKSLTEAAVDAGTILTTQMVKGLDNTELKGVTLKASLTALGGTLVGYFAQSLGATSDALTTTARDMTALLSTGQVTEYFNKVLSASYEILTIRIGQAFTALEDFFTASPAELSAHFEEANSKIAAVATGEVAYLDGLISHAISGYKDLIAETDRVTKIQAPTSAAPDNAAVKAVSEQYDSMIKQASDSYALLKQQYASDLAQHKISISEETADLENALDERWAIEQALFARELQLYAQGTSQYNNVLKQQQQAYQNYLKEREAAADAAAKQEAEAWKRTADTIAGAFNSQLSSMLQGKETWAQASRKIEADLALKFIEDQVKMTAEFLAEQARILAGKIAAESGMTAATTAGAALRSAAEVASGNESIAKVLANAISAIFASGGQTSAEVAAWSAPYAGPAAVGIGAAAGAEVIGSASSLAMYEVGTDYITQPGLAYIHRGEAIIPAFARGTGPYTGGDGAGSGKSGGGDVHLNISAMDSRSISRFFNDNASHMIKAIKKGMKNNAHLRTA
jgi:hypothetical protein